MLGELLAEQLHGTRDWTLKLLADLHGDDWDFQPAPGLAHARWICGHLAVSQNVLIHVRCLNQPALHDAFAAHFQIGGPVPSAADYAYPPIEEILRVMFMMHERTLTALRAAPDALFREPAFAADGKSPHPHYRDKFGAASHCSRHEAFHAGQLALIRRLRGKPFLR